MGGLGELGTRSERSAFDDDCGGGEPLDSNGSRRALIRVDCEVSDRRRFRGRSDRLSSSSNSLLFSGCGECRLGDGQGEEDWMRTVRLCSKIGRPHPHLRHFCPICCSHIPRHRISSSAKPFQCLLTWAARQRDMASRYPRTLSEISLGKTVKQSIRMSCARCSVSKDSWEKQHMVSKPWRIKARRGWEDEEKFDHIALTASRSWTGSASRD